MTLRYSLELNDYLQHQLFIASTSERVKRQRLRTWILLSVGFLLFGFVIYQKSDKTLSYLVFLFGLITLIFYPVYERNHYKKHYNKYIKDTYKNRFGIVSTITFTKEFVEMTSSSGEAKLNISEIESIAETSDYFFLKQRTGGHLIIPKSAFNKEEDRRAFESFLISDLKIPIERHLNWRWK